jgi:hypothetical protein
MDIEIIPTPDKPITGIRKRLITNDIQKTNPDFKALLNFFMKADKDSFYKNKQVLIGLMESTVKRAFIEGQRTGTVRTEFIKGGDSGFKKEEVYKKRTDNYVGD